MNYIIEFFTNLNSQVLFELAFAIAIVAALYLLSPLLSYVIIKIFHIRKSKKKIKQNAFYWPLKSFFQILGIYMALIYLKPVLGYSDSIKEIITTVFRIIVILNTSVGLAHSITKDSSFLQKMKEKSEKELDDTSLVFFIRFLRACIYIVAGFLVFHELGYDLSGLVTGLGLGTVVVSIAAQDTIKNLFGGIVIFFDRPFKVGEYIKFGEYEGTVEDLAWRSTKLRTTENSVVQIPNSEISSSTITNLSKMQKRRYSINLGIALDTNLDKLSSLEQEILKYMNNNEYIIENSASVFFNEIRTNDFCLSIYGYINIIDYNEFMKIKEKLNYGIMEIINKNNIELAYDTQTIELKKA